MIQLPTLEQLTTRRDDLLVEELLDQIRQTLILKFDGTAVFVNGKNFSAAVVERVSGLSARRIGFNSSGGWQVTASTRFPGWLQISPIENCDPQ